MPAIGTTYPFPKPDDEEIIILGMLIFLSIPQILAKLTQYTLLSIWRRGDLKALVAVSEGMVVILARLGPLVATLSTSKQGEIYNHPLAEVARFLANVEWRSRVAPLVVLSLVWLRQV